jgi:ABC-type enterobactin transport system permease subunit
VIFLLRYQINILSLGEDKARALGSPIETVQWTIFIAVSFISAGVVATSASSAGWDWSSRILRARWSGRITAGCCRLSALIGADLPAAGGRHRAHPPRWRSCRSASSPR